MSLIEKLKEELKESSMNNIGALPNKKGKAEDDDVVGGKKKKVEESKGGDIKLVISDETMALIDRDKKKDLKPILDKMIKDIKSDVTTVRI